MTKIVHIKFHDHPVLGDLELDFRGSDGKSADTIIFAGENGVGKSTIINFLYKLFTYSANEVCDVVLEQNGVEAAYKFSYVKYPGVDRPFYSTQGGVIVQPMIFERNNTSCRKIFGFSVIYSDVDINFQAKQIRTTSSMTIDSSSESCRSGNELPTTIKQLIIDIDEQDAREFRDAALRKDGTVIPDKRIRRFSRAFEQMFPNMRLQRVAVEKEQKNVMFSKFGKEFSIDQLSSGEKQIVFRGCFLLKDVNAIRGALVLIDEPEISLHPKWQMKILDYYKRIFTDADGNQTSQMFVVTHSPFVVHNDTRCNDKVIVLSRDKNGNIKVDDHPCYYKCDSLQLIEDAFHISLFNVDEKVVYTEGRTDKMYLDKANEILGRNPSYRIEWIGHFKGGSDKEENTGCSALNSGLQFLRGRNLKGRHLFLFDCDTNRNEKEETPNLKILTMPRNDSNSLGIMKGVENLLDLSDIPREKAYRTKQEKTELGEVKSNEHFEKMDLAEYICQMEDRNALMKILGGLGVVLDSIENKMRD